MTNYIASLSMLLALMFSGAVSWILLPIIVPIRFFLDGTDKKEAWGKLISDLVGIYILVSLVVQLTKDHLKINDGSSVMYPYISAFLVFVFSLEAAIDSREKLMREARKWTRYPQYIPEIQYWKVIPIIVLPLFILLFNFDNANVPYVYSGFTIGVEWLFHLPFIGPVSEWLAGAAGLLLLWGSLKTMV